MKSKNFFIKNIFLSHSISQSYFIVDLIAHYLIDNAVIFVEDLESFKFVKLFIKKNKRNFRVVKLASVHPGSLGPINYIESKKNFFKVNKIINKYNQFELNIFMTDIVWPINNFVFFKHKNKLNFSCIEDGLGPYLQNYYSLLLSVFFRRILRSFLFYLRLGPSYYFHSDSGFGFDKNIFTKFYLRSNISFLDNVNLVPYKTTSNVMSFKNKSLIFIDQPIYSEKISFLQEKLNIFLLKYVNNKFFIYFKSHPKILDKNKSILDNKFISYHIPKILPVDLINYNTAKNLVFISMCSSSLINLKKRYPRSECIAFYPRLYCESYRRSRLYIDNLIAFFKENKIKVIDI